MQINKTSRTGVADMPIMASLQSGVMADDSDADCRIMNSFETSQ